MRNKAGFSLVELIVVIAIIGVMTAIALPAYQTYSIRAKIGRSLPIIEGIATNLKSHYQSKGAFPTSFVINGVTVPANAWTNISGGSNYNGIFGMAYEVTADGRGLLLSSSLTGLNGIPGYVAPNTTNNYGTATNLMYGMREIGGVMNSACGKYLTVNGADIPAQYLPSGCNCLNTVNLYQNGTC